jgi:hypothetical protein
MNQDIQTIRFGEELPPIPEYEFDREGHKIETIGPTWHLVDEVHQSVTLHWNEFPVGDLKHAFMLWACYLIRSYAALAVMGIFRSTRTALKFNGKIPASISELDLDWWRANRQHHRERSWGQPLYYLRNWYLWLTDKDFPGTDEEVALTIEQWTFDKRPSGEAIIARDPDHGPLNARQFGLLTDALLQEQPATLGQAATFLCKELGPNTRNIALLRSKDLHVFCDPSDSKRKSYQIDIPRIKKRLTVRQTRRRPLSKAAGRVLEAIVNKNRERFGAESSQLPLFCREYPLERPGNRFPWQCTTFDIYRSVLLYGENKGLTVDGTQDGKFRINPRRLRYTYGTRLAGEGASVRHIADALDHSNESTAMVYVNASLSMVDRLFEHMDPKIAPIMDEFMGRMRARTESDTLIPGKTYSGALLGGIGVCGSGELCKRMPGLSCYKCNCYNPIADAPHSEMLKEAYSIRRLYLEHANNKTENAQFDFFDSVIVAIQGAIAASDKWKEIHLKKRAELQERNKDASILTGVIDVSAKNEAKAPK